MRLQRYKGYERPDGWSQGAPEVIVSPGAIKRLGMPFVDYPSLQQYFTDELAIPSDERTTIRLHGRFKHGLAYGHYSPFSKVVHVNAVMAENQMAKKGGVMAVVGHEGKHKSDHANHGTAVRLSIAARLAAVAGAYELSARLPEVPELPASYYEALPYFTTLGVVALIQFVDPLEIRARAEEKRMVDSSHQTDILFPSSPRTELLHEAGAIPVYALDALGLERPE